MDVAAAPSIPNLIEIEGSEGEVFTKTGFLARAMDWEKEKAPDTRSGFAIRRAMSSWEVMKDNMVLCV